MVKTIELLAIILAAVVLQCAAALAQIGCVSVCIGQLKTFVNCDLSSMEHPEKGRIGILGRIVEVKTAIPLCNTRVSIQVLRASVDTMPSRVDIDVDSCTRWVAKTDDVVRVHVVALADPTTGSYPLASCPF